MLLSWRVFDFLSFVTYFVFVVFACNQCEDHSKASYTRYRLFNNSIYIKSCIVYVNTIQWSHYPEFTFTD